MRNPTWTLLQKEKHKCHISNVYFFCFSVGMSNLVLKTIEIADTCLVNTQFVFKNFETWKFEFSYMVVWYHVNGDIVWYFPEQCPSARLRRFCLACHLFRRAFCAASRRDHPARRTAGSVTRTSSRINGGACSFVGAVAISQCCANITLVFTVPRCLLTRPRQECNKTSSFH
jgi:hypothetical protein